MPTTKAHLIVTVIVAGMFGGWTAALLLKSVLSDPRAEGTNKLLKGGATLVTDADDVLRALEPISGLRDGVAHLRWQPVAPGPVSEGSPPAVGDREYQMVLSALGPAPVDLDSVMRATGLSTRAVQIALMELDLAGHISRPGTGLIARRTTP